jgi:GT2 family glycosyltransferase
MILTEFIRFLTFPLHQRLSPRLRPLDGDRGFALEGRRLSWLFGWVTVRLRIKSDDFLSPYMHLDYGKGNAHSQRIDFHQIGEDLYQADIKLYRQKRRIHLYPNALHATQPYEIVSLHMRSCSEILHIYYQYTRIVWRDMMRLSNPYRIHIKSYKRYKKQGLVGMLDSVEEEFRRIQPHGARRVSSSKSRYAKWIKHHEREPKHHEPLHFTPLISVVMPTFNTPIHYLKQAIESVIAQRYTHWELCIADDASTNPKVVQVLEGYANAYSNIKVCFRQENGHIASASNSALSLASGEFVALLDHDDLLAKEALWEVAKAINHHPKASFIYSDEDKIDLRGVRYEPHFKSDWNEDMFYAHNYLSHLSVLRRSLIEQVGGFRIGFEGAQDYDLFLRVIDRLEEKEMVHIPKILYHWRATLGSTAFDSSQKSYTTQAGLRALQAHFATKDTSIEVAVGKVPNTYRVTYPLPDPLPLVSIIIPTRDHYETLRVCVESIVHLTAYPNYEILIMDNQTSQKEALAYFEYLKENPKVRVIAYDAPFNYAGINNEGVKEARGDIVALLNNDTEVIDTGWLGEMVAHALRDEIGAVGAMLYYPNDTIQHAGVILGIGGVANHGHKGFRRGVSGYFARLVTTQNYSAVTGACLVVKKSLYERVGGMDEERLVVAFNDVDLCLKFLQEGVRNLWTPYASLYHHESLSRGKEETLAQKRRFGAEVAYMQAKWKEQLSYDRYYNPNLSRYHSDFRLSADNEIKGAMSVEGYENLNAWQSLSSKAREALPKLSEHFIINFRTQEYLDANTDLIEELERGRLKSAFEHFVRYGYAEVAQGVRRIGVRFPFYEESAYLASNPMVVLEIEGGKFENGYEHFILFGYEESIKAERAFVGAYPFAWSKRLKLHVKGYFDAKEYLGINPDVARAIEEGEFVDAWDHFERLGVEEIRQGERQLHRDIDKISEHAYAQGHGDIFDEVESEMVLRTPFEHFLWQGVQEVLEGKRKLYRKVLYRYQEPLRTKSVNREMDSFAYQPLISIVMPVYNVEVKWLALAIDSLKAQWYRHWELCMVDDASDHADLKAYLEGIDDPKIRIAFLEENHHICEASNRALSLARGEYVALMDHDDTLSSNAFFEVVKAINLHGAEFIYSDEDKIDENGAYCDPHFKPNYAPQMLYAQNYISHLGVIKRSLIERVGGWSVGLEGSQDYDLYLKVVDQTTKIVHIPKVLYHWRKVEGSTAVAFEEKSYAKKAGKIALERALKRQGEEGEVRYGHYVGTYRVQYAIKGAPLVSIIIPFCDKPHLLKVCIESLLDRSTYGNYEIIGVSNNSVQEETFALMEQLGSRDERVRFYAYNIPFNYSKINNHAVKKYAKGTHVLLLNNDIEIISPDWIEAMLSFSQRQEIGAVGAKLYYANDTIQHAGVSMGVLGLTGHNFRYLPKEATGYMGRESVIQNVSAVTGACLMVKRDLYLAVEGMNEEDLRIAFNDIDLCLRIGELGYRNLFTPYAELYHYESLTRGYEDTPKKLKRFHGEVDYMKRRHHAILEQGDPYYNCNFTLEREDFDLKDEKSTSSKC